MGRELTHPEVVGLLGAYALDALEGEERDAVGRHAQGCWSCMAEIVDHREVAGLLTPGWAKPPAGLWDKIAASLVEVPPPLDLAPVIAMKPGGGRGRVVAGSRRSFGIGIAAMIAAAAVALVGVLGFRVVDDNRRIANFALGQPGQELQRTVAAAQAAPNARKVSLTSTDGYRTASAVVLPDGTGYLVKTNLPTLSPDRTYQLWALVGTSRISVGVLGSEPQIVPFKIDGQVWALAITDEVKGGVETTKREPVVVGKIEDA